MRKKKRFYDYHRSKETKKFYQGVSEVNDVPAEQLVIMIKGGYSHLRGTWVHPDIGVDLARWVDRLFAVKVSKLVQAFANGDLSLIPQIIENKNEATGLDHTVLASKADSDVRMLVGSVTPDSIDAHNRSETMKELLAKCEATNTKLDKYKARSAKKSIIIRNLRSELAECNDENDEKSVIIRNQRTELAEFKVSNDEKDAIIYDQCTTIAKYKSIIAEDSVMYLNTIAELKDERITHKADRAALVRMETDFKNANAEMRMVNYELSQDNKQLVKFNAIKSKVIAIMTNRMKDRAPADHLPKEKLERCVVYRKYLSSQIDPDTRYNAEYKYYATYGTEESVKAAIKRLESNTLKGEELEQCFCIGGKEGDSSPNAKKLWANAKKYIKHAPKISPNGTIPEVYQKWFTMVKTDETEDDFVLYDLYEMLKEKHDNRAELPVIK